MRDAGKATSNRIIAGFKGTVMLVAFLLIVGLTACDEGTQQEPETNDKLSIVTSIFPEYDWVQNILGENPSGAEVSLLLDKGVDLHSYQPTAGDIQRISTCDLFVYVGGESDEWVADALEEATNKDMVVINLLDALGDRARAEELVEGMEEPQGEDAAEDEATEYDEHVWLSLKNAPYLVNVLSEAMQSIDADHGQVYKRNAETYIKKLAILDEEYQSAVANGRVKTLLFGDRFPFRYLAEDYGLSYYAAFAGCSAETEASFETITFLAQKADALSLHAVMTIEGTKHKIAETIVQNTKARDLEILAMDSMQSTTARDVQKGSTYLSIMEKNLQVLRNALK